MGSGASAFATSETMTAAPKPSHMPALDGLRGLAILLVIPHNMNLFGAEGFVRVFTLGASAGWIGVQLFFVLSGFLITLGLLDSLGSTNYYRNFYARRALRIFPLYYGTLALLFAVLPAMGLPVVEHPEHQAWLWLYVSNWTDPFGLNVRGLGHFWSLAVEEQFYLTWPLLVAVFSRRLLRLCLTVAGVALVGRLGLLLMGASRDAVYLFTVCRMDALVLGAAAAMLFSTPGFSLPPGWSGSRLFWKGFSLIVAGAILTNVYSNLGFASLSFGFSLLAVAFAMMTLAAATPGAGWWRTVLEFAPLRSVGKYSYAMYVFHLPINLIWQSSLLGVLGWTGAMRPVAYMALVTVLSYASAFVSYHILEKHFLKLKKFFAPQHTFPRGTSTLEGVAS